MTLRAYIAALVALEAEHGDVEVVSRVLGSGILRARRPMARHRMKLGQAEHAHFFFDESEAGQPRAGDRLVIEIG